MSSVVDLSETDYVTAPGDQSCLANLYAYIKGSPLFRAEIEKYFASLGYEDKSAFVEDHEEALAPLAATLFHIVTYAEESEILEVAAPEVFGSPMPKRVKISSPEEAPPPPSSLNRSRSMY